MTMIDFPQMVSVSHPNAKMYFERDAECLRIYFARKFGLDEEDGLQLIPRYTSCPDPRWTGPCSLVHHYRSLCRWSILNFIVLGVLCA